MLETEVLVVPSNDPERLALFPPLQSKNFEFTGIGNNQSAADIVLSSAGVSSIFLMTNYLRSSNKKNVMQLHFFESLIKYNFSTENQKIGFPIR